MDGMQTKIAGPSSFTRLGTGTRAKRPLVVELPRKVNRRWTTSSPETGCKGPAIVEIDRSLRQQKPKRTSSADSRSNGSVVVQIVHFIHIFSSPGPILPECLGSRYLARFYRRLVAYVQISIPILSSI